MHFSKLLLLAVATILPAATSACKCIDRNTKVADTATTKAACADTGGKMNGDDCAASSMSQSLHDFEDNCEGYGYDSDCPCSTC